MTEILRIATTVATPLALITFIGALAYFAYARRLQYEERKLEALPPNERAVRTDEYLTRYGIDGKGLSPADKLALIREEMTNRHQRSLGYVRIAAVVFVVSFGLAVVAYFLRPGPDPVTLPKTTFRVFDKTTKDPVYRPFEITYRLAGADESARKAHQGQFELRGEAADVLALTIDCPGYQFYSFDANQERKLSTQIELERRPPEDDFPFEDAITPSVDPENYFSTLVSDDEYKREVKHQVLGEPIRLICNNQTPYRVNFVLYPWIPKIPGVRAPEFAPSWTALDPACDDGKPETYVIDDFYEGAYYFVFGSVCGLEATLLWHGNLHRSTPPTLNVTLDPIASGPENPQLVGKLIN